MKAIRLFFLCLAVLVGAGILYSDEGAPQRIISLGPAATEELYLLGVGDKIIGNTTYCTLPPEAQKKEKVGTVTKANLEKIIGLKPDLVLATPLTDRQQLQKMKALKINVVEIPRERNFEEICGNFLKIGGLVGRQKEAEEIVSRAKAKTDFIKNKAKNTGRRKILVQIGINPLFVATKEYFISDVVESAGGINIARDVKTGLYNREEVLRQNPDVIIIAAMGIEGEEEKRAWQKYSSVNAVRNNRIYIIDPYKLCSLTPLSFVEAQEEMAKILQSAVIASPEGAKQSPSYE